MLEAHDPKWLVELTVSIGRYAALAGLLNGFELMPDNAPEVLPVEAVPATPSTRGPVRAPLAEPRVLVTSSDQLAEADRSFFDARGARGLAWGSSHPHAQP